VSSVEVVRCSTPDKQFDCVVYERNGGATTSFVYWVFVVPAKQKVQELTLLPDTQCMVANLYGSIRNSNSFGVNVHWQDSSHLVIDCLKTEITEFSKNPTLRQRKFEVTLNQGVNDPSVLPIYMDGPRNIPQPKTSREGKKPPVD